ncbi:CD3e molecule, epsilon associated protein [Fundulus heteroclitus]|uniref:CD3e molecule, epsilon associated protein n=1 Tax=Fundulus heteroclitus TaxID=8078 RepID=UPI00165BED4A|nr:CD3e molecule, epsilon associated protein [Fundulus heteroclitus]
MPKDISSSSSSEDEAEDVAMETTAPPIETDQRNTRFECPEDFVSFCHVPCSSTLADNLRNDDNELWLIKAPASFEPQCFSGVRVPLAGLQTVKVRSTSASEPAQQIYSVLASSRCPADLRLLTSDSQAPRRSVFAPAFAGLLNICESYGDGSGSQVPHVIPAAPPPSIPPGLKQRFHPFGSKTPTLTCVAENEADGAAFGPSSTTLRPLVMKRFVEEGGRVEEDNDQEEEGRKRKKKKKEKRIKAEEMEVLLKVKREPSDEFPDDGMKELPFQEGDPQAKKAKKKKKKTKEEEDREREEVEEGLEPSVRIKPEPVSVKCEPEDYQYGDAAESSGKKKKKKKRSKAEQD